MDITIGIEEGDGLFFKFETFNGDKLNQFLLFLKERGRSYYSFAYSPAYVVYQRGMTLKEIITLEALPTRIQTSSQDHISEVLRKQNNPALIKLRLLLGDLDRSSHEVTSRELKILSLFITLLKETKVMIMDQPEELLLDSEFALFKEAMSVEQSKKRILLLSSSKESDWLNIVNKIVVKTQDRRFSIFKKQTSYTSIESLEKILKSA